MSNLNARFFAAAQAGVTPLCLDLIARGVDVNVADKNGWSALHWGAFRSHSDTCLALLEQGAQVDAKNYYGHHPLHIAAQAGHTSSCLALIEYGADVNALCLNKYSPLHFAVHGGQAAACLILLEHGCDPLIKNNKAQTAMDLARGNGHTDCVNVIQVWLSAHAARMALREIACPEAGKAAWP